MHPNEHDDDVEHEFDGPSRSQRRRDALAVLSFAEQLVALTPNRLKQIELPDDVRSEIAEVQRMRANGARKRQMAFLAKLMRRHDEDAFAPARAALGENRQQQRQDKAALQRLETLREQLIDEGDEALSSLIESYPEIDRQHLRSLIRQARSERKRNKPPRASRELFRFLRGLGDEHE